jgi:hypothetical protein
LNGKPKWNQLVADLKSGKKRNDGSSSNKSIGLDNEEDDVVAMNGKATVPKDNRQVMRNKWEKACAARDAVATKMSSTWTGIFFGEGEHEGGEVQAHVGCAKENDGVGQEDGGEETQN